MPCTNCSNNNQMGVNRDNEPEGGRNCIDKTSYKELVKNYHRTNDGHKRKRLKALHDAIDETTKNWEEHQAIAGFGAQAKYDIQQNTYCYDKRPGVGLNLYCEDELEETAPWGGFLKPREESRAHHPECEDLVYEDCPPISPCADHKDPGWLDDVKTQCD